MKSAFIGLLLMATAIGCWEGGATTMDERSGDRLPKQQTVNLAMDGHDRSFIVLQPLGYDNAGKIPFVYVIQGEAVPRRV